MFLLSPSGLFFCAISIERRLHNQNAALILQVMKRTARAFLKLMLIALMLLGFSSLGLADEGFYGKPQPAPIRRTGGGSVARLLKVQSMDFYYRMEQESRYLDLKNQWQSHHRGEITQKKAIEFARQADQASDMETPLTAWQYQGGPAPYIFRAKAHIFSTAPKAMLNVPFTISVRANVGQLGVIPSLQLTDYERLRSSARWVEISKKTVTVPAIAPGEDLLLPLMEFQLLLFLERHPQSFPVTIEVLLSSPQLGSVSKTLPLTPDHFVMPVFY